MRVSIRSFGLFLFVFLCSSTACTTIVDPNRSMRASIFNPPCTAYATQQLIRGTDTARITTIWTFDPCPGDSTLNANGWIRER